jgi:hypothetical protein
MTSRTAFTAVVQIGLLLVTAGCAAGTAGSQPDQTNPLPAPETLVSPPAATAAASTALPTGAATVELDPAGFSATVTNRYWPLEPRTRWTYREVIEDGTVSETVVVATTKTRKIANGITARVVRDTVREDGEIIEDTYDWYAQDRAGNVWYLGEDTAEFSEGKITSREGSFEAGVDGAQAGLIMPAHPWPGMRYRQEYYRGRAEDNGEVLSVAELVEAPIGRYRNALLIKDTTTIEPAAAEHKFYAPGVGLVLTLQISGGAGREELIKVDRAGPNDGTGPMGHPNG